MYPYLHRLCLAVFLIASLPAKAQMPVLKIAGNASGSVSLQQLDIDVRRLITLQLQDSNEKETAYIGSFSF